MFLSYEVICIHPNCCLYPNKLFAFFPTIVSILLSYLHSSQLLFLSYQVTCILPNCCLYLTKLLPNFLIAVTILPSYFPTIVSILPSALHPYQQLFLSHLVTFILPNYCFCLTKLHILPNFFNLTKLHILPNYFSNLTKLHILPNYFFYLTKSLLNFLNIVTFFPSYFLISQLFFLSYQVTSYFPKYCYFLTKLLPNFPTIVSILPSSLHPSQILFPRPKLLQGGIAPSPPKKIYDMK